MKSKARILLISLVVTCATSISVAFHNCYVIDALHPELPENTPPIIDYTTVGIDGEERIFGSYDIPYESEKFVQFEIGKIWDPDPGDQLIGDFLIDYYGTGVPSRGPVIFIKGNDEIWSASFKFIMQEGLDAGCHEVIAVITDRSWVVCEDCDPYTVPEDTSAAVARWIIDTRGEGSAIPCLGNIP